MLNIVRPADTADPEFDREIECDLEGKINDLARLAHAIFMVSESIFENIQVYEKSFPQVATMMEMMEQDVEVLTDQILEADCQASALRKVFYLKHP